MLARGVWDVKASPSAEGARLSPGDRRRRYAVRSRGGGACCRSLPIFDVRTTFSCPSKSAWRPGAGLRRPARRGDGSVPRARTERRAGSAVKGCHVPPNPVISRHEVWVASRCARRPAGRRRERVRALWGVECLVVRIGRGTYNEECGSRPSSGTMVSGSARLWWSACAASGSPPTRAPHARLDDWLRAASPLLPPPSRHQHPRSLEWSPCEEKVACTEANRASGRGSCTA